MKPTTGNTIETRSPNAIGASSADDIRLPLAPDAPGGGRSIRPSKNAPRRAVVLAVVQGLIIAHVVQWWLTGTTVSPIEPSEAMEFGRQGIINAGFIFFATALIATVVFGRWLCGWGCHLVMLQDLCGWIMKKCGVRPKPFRSRLLMFVPLALGLYMFVWPAFYWLAVAPWLPSAPHWPGFDVALSTSDFWKTFPGWMLATPFLLICGFGTVYFLGAKGFCTYGCPYGGFFAPLDELAPARIRVTDACEQCGHCTAVCTSNVRVHEEVREYGMVVDPGCMKCLDCVSVCPNDALYYGFGKPAVKKGPARHATPGKHYDLSMREEIAFLVVFGIAFFALRGDVARFPLLMTAGMASIITFLTWKLWTLRSRANVRLHGFQLRRDGKASRSGRAYVVLVALIMGLIAHCGLINLAFLHADRLDRNVTLPLEVVFGEAPFALPDPVERDARRAVAWYRACSSFSNGGWWWQTGAETHVRLAWLQSCLGDYDAALEHMTEALALTPDVRQRHLDLAMILDRLGRAAEADDQRARAAESSSSTGTMRE